MLTFVDCLGIGDDNGWEEIKTHRGNDADFPFHERNVIHSKNQLSINRNLFNLWQWCRRLLFAFPFPSSPSKLMFMHDTNVQAIKK